MVFDPATMVREINLSSKLDFPNVLAYGNNYKQQGCLPLLIRHKLTFLLTHEYMDVFREVSYLRQSCT